MQNEPMGGLVLEGQDRELASIEGIRDVQITDAMSRGHTFHYSAGKDDLTWSEKVSVTARY